MKSTTVKQKSSSVPRTMHVKNYKLWLVVSCAALLGIWYICIVLGFFGANTLINMAADNSSSRVYGFLVSFASIAAVFIAAAVGTPFAVAVFKRLRIQKPLVSAIAFFMAPTFGATLFAFITGISYYQQQAIYIILAVSMVVAGLFYGFFIRSLKHRLSAAKFLAISIGLAVLPVVAWFLQRLLVTSLI